MYMTMLLGLVTQSGAELYVLFVLVMNGSLKAGNHFQAVAVNSVKKSFLQESEVIS
jgi:hypothetical protein